MGTYNRYDDVKTEKGGIYYFLKSLRHYNKTCKIFIVCEVRYQFQALKDICAEYDCILYDDFNVAYEMMYYRFVIYQKILRENSDVGKILLCDTNDLIFQADPFEIEFKDLYCALEQNRYDDLNSSSMFNLNIMRDCEKKMKMNLDLIKEEYVI